MAGLCDTGRGEIPRIPSISAPIGACPRDFARYGRNVYRQGLVLGAAGMALFAAAADLWHLILWLDVHGSDRCRRADPHYTGPERRNGGFVARLPEVKSG
jgi:hypothetical protein